MLKDKQLIDNALTDIHTAYSKLDNIGNLGDVLNGTILEAYADMKRASIKLEKVLEKLNE